MKLRNRTNRTVTVNLDHDVVCAEDECLCSSQVHRSIEHDGKTGDTGVRETERRVCASVHILPKETSDELPESVKDLPEVRSALNLRTLVAE